jgi:hypothetical protein
MILSQSLPPVSTLRPTSPWFAWQSRRDQVRVLDPAAIGHATQTVTAGTPFFDVACVILYIETDSHVWVGSIEFRHGSLQSSPTLRVVAAP